MILNYTTQVKAEKTLMEIQQMLSRAKAQAIMTEYDDGILCSISFRIQTTAGLIAFQLPGNVQKVYQVMIRDRGVPARFRTRDQASRVAWRIIKDWLEAQLALIQAGMVDLEQVFLPYAQHADGVTVYERVRANAFDTLALPAK